MLQLVGAGVAAAAIMKNGSAPQLISAIAGPMATLIMEDFWEFPKKGLKCTITATYYVNYWKKTDKRPMSSSVKYATPRCSRA